MRNRIKIFAGALVLAGIQICARANLVVNGSFETGNFSGWTLSQSASLSDVTTGSYAQSGSYGAGLTTFGSDGYLSQTIATTIGDTYDITYWHAGYNSGPNDFTASFGGVVLFSYLNSSTQPITYTEYTFTEVATSLSSVFQFTFRNDFGFQKLDNVCVVDAGAASVPDSGPGLALIIVTLLGVCGISRKLRRQIVVKS